MKLRKVRERHCNVVRVFDKVEGEVNDSLAESKKGPRCVYLGDFLVDLWHWSKGGQQKELLRCRLESVAVNC